MLSSCCLHDRAAASLFSRLAPLFRLKERLFGLERSQKLLLEGLSQLGFWGSDLLEIGFGTGALHRKLLKLGAGRVFGVELAPEMVAMAEQEAEREGLSERVSYWTGDFLELAPRLPIADIALLDKVICCYPDAEGLLQAAARHARRGIALIYPIERPLIRIGAAAMNLSFRAIGSDFRVYLHPERLVAGTLSWLGFERIFRKETPIWCAELYRRALPEEGSLSSPPATGLGRGSHPQPIQP